MTDLEQSLRDTLQGRAGVVEVREDPVPRIEHAVTGDRRSRRQVAAAGAALLAVLAAGGGAFAREHGRTPPAPASTTSTAPAPDRSVHGPITSWAPRGRLSSDPAFRSAVRGIVPAGSRWLYADVVGGDRVVVASQPGGDAEPQVKAWVFPADAPLAQLGGHMRTLDVQSGDEPFVTLALGERRGAAVLVLGTSDVAACQVSDAPVLHPDASVDPRWRSVPMHDGVGVTSVRSAVADGVRVRYLGYGGGLDAIARADGGQSPVLEDSTDPRTEGELLAQRLMARHGWSPSDVSTRVVARTVGRGQERWILVTALVQPHGGPVVVTTGTIHTTPTSQDVTSEMHPGLVPAGQEGLMTVGFDISGQGDAAGPVHRALVVPGPDSRVRRIRVYEGAASASRVLAEGPVRDGVMTFLDPGAGVPTGDIELLDIAGRVLGTHPSRPAEDAVDDLGVPIWGAGR